METQTYASAHIPVQSLLTVGFHFTKSERLILLALAICGQVLPFATQWNLSQFETMLGCVGSGVEMPLPLEVVVSFWDIVVADLVVVVVGDTNLMVRTQT